MTIKRRRLVVGTLWLTLLAAGLIGTWRQQPQLRIVCSSIDELCQEWGRDFTRHTGIPTSVVRLSSGQALTRLQHRPGEFDVWHGGPAETYIAAADLGLLQSYRPAEVEETPVEYRDPNFRWTGTYRGMLGFCVNRDHLARLGIATPTSWEDLLDPRLAGMVTAPDPAQSGTGYTMLWTQVERLGSPDAAMEYLRRLDANIEHYSSSGIALAGITGRGEATVAITFTQHCERAKALGMPVETSYPRGITGFELGAVAIVASSPHRELAQRYVDYAHSRDAQTLRADRFPQLPARRDIPGAPALELPAGTQLYRLDMATAAARRQEMLGLYADRVRR